MINQTFFHNFIDIPTCSRVEIDGVRYYQTPAGTFKSVTTILGEKLDKSGLLQWQERVGKEEAAKVATQASRRGTAIHNIAEAYLLNKPDWKRGHMPVNLDTFSRIKPILDRNIGSIYGIEIPLYSAKLKAAGTCDLLAGYNGINSVIDFKTSKRIKKEEDIEGYFLQAACYSWCVQELTELKFPQIVIIMSVDDDNPLVFIKKAEDYYKKLFDIFT